MKLFIAIVLAAFLPVLLTGCQSPQEQEQHVEQRRYDRITKQGQETIEKNRQRIMYQNQ
jgi:hypothetical protein